MSSEYNGPGDDPNRNNRRPTSELWGQWGKPDMDELDDEDTQPHRAVSLSSPFTRDEQQKEFVQQQPATPAQQPPVNPEQFVHREHVTGALPASHSSDAPLFRPAYGPYPVQPRPAFPQPGPGYPAPQPAGQHYPVPVSPYPPQAIPPYVGYPAQPGYPPAYGTHPGYNGYPYNGYGYPPPYYVWQPPRPKRDGFRLATLIIALSGGIIAVLCGLGSVLLLLLFMIVAANPVSRTTISDQQYFNSVTQFTAFALAGLASGGFSIYHSIRGMLNKPSARLRLPWFWIFLVLYLLVLGVGYALHANGQEVAIVPLSIFLITLVAIFPATALLALGVRRLRFPAWPTTWRRFTLAMSSGATLGISLAFLLELGFLALLGERAGTTSLQCVNDPTLPGCDRFTAFSYIFILVAIIAPLVEETIKPLGVAFYMGRVKSASEAFVLGMSAGIGFAIVETMGYIGAGYHDWLNVAFERTGASLLHGFGAAMVTLGWYYFIQTKERQVLKAFGFWAYAVFQHFVWNGTVVLALLPAPYGPTLNSWNLNLGFITLSFFDILNTFEAILILVFFLYMTGRLRRKAPPTSLEKGRPGIDEGKPANETQVPARAY